jgi:hypothetical protein
MIYECRRYECMPGKLPALRALMKDLAVPVFKRVGMKLIGAWEPLAGDIEATVIYILAFESLEERNSKWKAFYEDPEWNEKRAKIAEKEGGPIVAKSSNVFWTAAEYSPLQ